MTTITRRLASQVRAVCRRAFGSTRTFGPAVCFLSSPSGLHVRAKSADVAVEYRGEGGGGEDRLWLPLQALADFEGKKDEPVQLEAPDKGRVTAQWSDRGVPQLVLYDAADPVDAAQFPSIPDDFAENPPGLLAALHDAMETTNPDPIRYATNHVQLQGQAGKLVATDGRQLLVQSGYRFPWEGSTLIPRTTVFGCRELPQDAPVAIGKAGDWMAVRVGPWTIWLSINKDGRFPEVERHISRVADATSHCQFSAADAEFLIQALPRLPSDDEYNGPVTFDLNGAVVVRAKPIDQSRPTEAVLGSSTCSGEQVRIHTNRRYLARALRLGLRELHLYGSKNPVLCQDDCRQYLWALLDPDSAIEPAADPIRIESPAAGPQTPIPNPKPERRTSVVSETIAKQNDHTQADNQASGRRQVKANGQARKTTPRKAAPPDAAALIQQTEALRQSLRETLGKTTELLKGLKRHRRQSRALESTIASLRQLKGLGV